MTESFHVSHLIEDFRNLVASVLTMVPLKLRNGRMKGTTDTIPIFGAYLWFCVNHLVTKNNNKWWVGTVQATRSKSEEGNDTWRHTRNISYLFLFSGSQEEKGTTLKQTVTTDQQLTRSVNLLERDVLFHCCNIYFYN